MDEDIKTMASMITADSDIALIGPANGEYKIDRDLDAAPLIEASYPDDDEDPGYFGEWMEPMNLLHHLTGTIGEYERELDEADDLGAEEKTASRILTLRTMASALMDRIDQETPTVPVRSMGLVVPDDSGITYSTVTGGVSCRHVSIEGHFIPLGRPTTYVTDLEDWMSNEYFPMIRDISGRDEQFQIDLCDALRHINYVRSDAGEEAKEWTWQHIKENQTRLSWQPLPPDMVDDRYRSQEGMRWVRITSGPFAGRKAALIYPNSD